MHQTPNTGEISQIIRNQRRPPRAHLNSRPHGNDQWHPVGEGEDPSLNNPTQQYNRDEKREQRLLNLQVIQEPHRLLDTKTSLPPPVHDCLKVNNTRRERILLTSSSCPFKRIPRTRESHLRNRSNSDTRKPIPRESGASARKNDWL